MLLLCLLPACNGLHGAPGNDLGAPGGSGGNGGAGGNGGNGGAGGGGGNGGNGGSGGFVHVDGGTGPINVDGGAPPQCSGTALTSDTTIDFDIKGIDVSGTVTVHTSGGDNVAAAKSRLVFTALDTAATAQVSIADGGRYRATLAAGRYDIGWQATSCFAGTPCNAAVFQHDVMLTQSGTLDLTVPVVHVTGTVTSNGKPAANGVYVRFSDSAGYTDADQSMGADYVIDLVAGTYDVSNTGLCGGSNDCNQAVLQSALRIDHDGRLDIDVASVHVGGTVTIGGVHAASGNLRFVRQGGGSIDTGSFGATTWTYDLHLLSGRYDVWWVPPSSCTHTTPCNAGLVKAGVQLDADTTLDVDVPFVHVNGSVMLNGGGVTDGHLRFALGGGGSADSTGFNAATSTYTAEILPGTYDIWFVPNTTTCHQSPVPCVAVPLRSGVTLASDGKIDLTMTSADVSGQVTMRGAPLLSGGTLSLRRSAGGDATPIFLSTSNSTYELSVVPGTYDVIWNGPTDSYCDSVPCASGVIKSNVAINGQTFLDIDVPAVKVQGQISYAGMPAAGWAISLMFYRVGGGTPAWAEGRPSYGTMVLPGTYVVRYSAAATHATCDSAEPLACDDEILLGCP